MIKIINRLPTEEEYPRVRHLVLQHPEQEVTDEQVAVVFAACPRLESVALSGISDTSDETLALLAQTAANLQGIDLNGCTQVTDVGVVALTTKPLPLQWICLSGVVTLTDQSVFAIARAGSHLMDLDLCDLPLITPLSVSDLWTHLRKLRSLRLARCPLLTDEAFPSRQRGQETGETDSQSLLPPLALRYGAENLRTLDLSHCRITDETIEGIITYAPKIQNLFLNHCAQLTDRALDSISRLGENLDVLSMAHVSKLSDASIVNLIRSCPKLRGVDLGFCENLTDMSVFELASLSGLRRLSLSGLYNITDIAIYTIAEQLPELERFYLAHCNLISLEAIHILLKRLQKLQQVNLTGVPSCQRRDMEQFSEPPPVHLDSEERITFRVYNGQNVSLLRRFLDIEEQQGLDDETGSNPFALQSE
ncbi:hypothetical protein AX15_007236 [Amanita polypyramis BW_CC]|nr:hypothetical protein AX15_007236 [Amanita polypyramis BW_CC]